MNQSPNIILSPESKEKIPKYSNLVELDLNSNLELQDFSINPQITPDILNQNKLGETVLNNFIKFCFEGDLSIEDKSLMKKFFENFRYVSEQEFNQIFESTAKKIFTDLKKNQIDEVELYVKKMGLSSLWMATELQPFLQQRGINAQLLSRGVNAQKIDNILSIDDGTFTGKQDSYYINNSAVKNRNNLGQYFLFGTKSAYDTLDNLSPDKIYINTFVPSLEELFTNTEIIRLITILHLFIYDGIDDLVKFRSNEVSQIKKNILFLHYNKVPDNIPDELRKSGNKSVLKNYRGYAHLGGEDNI